MAKEMLVLRNVCINFPVLIVPKKDADKEVAKEKYSCTIMVPKSSKDQIAKIEAAVQATIDEGGTTLGAKKAGLKLPLRDGDEKADEYPEFKDFMFFNCSTVRRPRVFDMEKQEIIDLEEVIYSGQIVNVSLIPFAYNFNGTKGIGMGLHNLQIVGGGERWFDDAGAEF